MDERGTLQNMFYRSIRYCDQTFRVMYHGGPWT